MTLDSKQRQHFRGLAHKLKPIIMVGNAGVSAAVLGELEIALEHHELLKIRLPGVERDQRAAMVQEICRATGADLVQEIGRMAVLYRKSREPKRKTAATTTAKPKKRRKGKAAPRKRIAASR